MLKNLILKRPMAFIDLETTGNRYYADRIVEFSVLKIHPDGSEKYKSRRANPEMPISPGALEVHGINDAALVDEPVFRQLAKGICDFLEGCDLSGFNILGFDLPLLENEFERVGIEFSRDNRQIVDSMAIFHMREPYGPDSPRNLQAAYQKYCNKELANAHSADNDVRASAEILDGQLQMYEDLPRDAEGLCSVCLEPRKNFIDIAGRFAWLEEEVVFNFGKHRGLPIKEIAYEYPDYLSWILSQEFSPEVRNIVKDALDGIFLERTY
ncbi:exonuclease domain-containing protein [Chloroflexota bacterium]